MLFSTAERDVSLILMSFTNCTSSNPSIDKPSRDSENLPSQSALSGDNNELTEMPYKPSNNFQKVYDEFNNGTRPYGKHMASSVDQKSSSIFTERNSNSRVTDAKYLDCLCTGPIQEPLEGNTWCANSSDDVIW